MERFDKYLVGIISGILLPFVFGWLYIDQMNLWYAISSFGIKSMAGVIGKLTIVALFPDMALIFLFYTLELWRAAKGVIISMFPYILAAIWISI